MLSTRTMTEEGAKHKNNANEVAKHKNDANEALSNRMMANYVAKHMHTGK